MVRLYYYNIATNVLTNQEWKGEPNKGHNRNCTIVTMIYIFIPDIWVFSAHLYNVNQLCIILQLSIGMDSDKDKASKFHSDLVGIIPFEIINIGKRMIIGDD